MARRGLEPARSIIAKLGGEEKVAAITETAITAPYRWQAPVEKRGTGGTIPQRYHVLLLTFAAENGIPLSADDFLQRDPEPIRRAS
jgi:hypothetical protein